MVNSVATGGSARANALLPGGLWLTWERHRRSETLARALGARYVPLVSGMPRPLRYGLLTLKTIGLLLNERPRLVFAQNPSIVLAALLCVLRRSLGYFLVVDRHSNLELESRQSASVKWRIFHVLSRFTNRKADLTIVTNDFLKRVIEDDGGRGFVLQDKLPEAGAPSARADLPHPCGAFICTYSPDEPIDEVLLAIRELVAPVHIFVTGKPRMTARQRQMLRDIQDRVTLTGFLPDDRYWALVGEVDFAIILTTQEHTLVCGAYEAVSLGKPVILSDTDTIRAYFRQGAVYCLPTAASIASAINEMINSLTHLHRDVQSQRAWMQSDWVTRFDDLCGLLRTRLPPRGEPSRHGDGVS